MPRSTVYQVTILMITVFTLGGFADANSKAVVSSSSCTIEELDTWKLIALSAIAAMAVSILGNISLLVVIQVAQNDIHAFYIAHHGLHKRFNRLLQPEGKPASRCSDQERRAVWQNVDCEEMYSSLDNVTEGEVHGRGQNTVTENLDNQDTYCSLDTATAGNGRRPLQSNVVLSNSGADYEESLLLGPIDEDAVVDEVHRPSELPILGPNTSTPRAALGLEDSVRSGGKPGKSRKRKDGNESSSTRTLYEDLTDSKVYEDVHGNEPSTGVSNRTSGTCSYEHFHNFNDITLRANPSYGIPHCQCDTPVNTENPCYASGSHASAAFCLASADSGSCSPVVPQPGSRASENLMNGNSANADYIEVIAPSSDDEQASLKTTDCDSTSAVSLFIKSDLPQYSTGVRDTPVNTRGPLHASGSQEQNSSPAFFHEVSDTGTDNSLVPETESSARETRIDANSPSADYIEIIAPSAIVKQSGVKTTDCDSSSDASLFIQSDLTHHSRVRHTHVTTGYPLHASGSQDETSAAAFCNQSADTGTGNSMVSPHGNSAGEQRVVVNSLNADYIEVIAPSSDVEQACETTMHCE
eukprot:scpid59546/ scgid12595/ 